MRNKRFLVMLSIFGFVLALIVMSSAIFRVRHVVAYGHNSNDAELEQLIVDAAPIRRGQSIFSVRDRSVVNELHGQIANIRVVNVERRFPNRVFINFVQRFEYFQISYGGYYFITDETLHTLRYASNRPNLIELRLSEALAAPPAVGQSLAAPTQEIAMATEFMRIAGRRAATLFVHVDFGNHNSIILQTREGIRFRFIGTENLAERLHFALYVFDNTLPSYRRTGGTLYILNNDSVHWSESY